MGDRPCLLEHSVEAHVPAAFAWTFWTEVKNWDDPPAQFTIEGLFAEDHAGQSRGRSTGRLVSTRATDTTARSWDWLCVDDAPPVGLAGCSCRSRIDPGGARCARPGCDDWKSPGEPGTMPHLLRV
jgi:hypothetical protein